MGTWVRNGTTVKLDQDSDAVAIGGNVATRKLEVSGIGLLELQDRGGEVFNVKAYGAVGDNFQDDTSAIEAAIAAVPASGAIVYFPPGTYRISSSISISKPITILGAGVNSSIVRAWTPDQNTFDITVVPLPPPNRVVGVVFRDLRFDTQVVKTGGVTIDEQNLSGLHHGIRIENCHFKGHQNGVRLTRSAAAIIENCIFWSGVASESDVWIESQLNDTAVTHIVGCTFADFTDQPAPNNHIAAHAIKATRLTGGLRIQNNILAYYDTQILIDTANPACCNTSHIIGGNILEAARTALIRLTGTGGTSDSYIQGNTFAIGQIVPPGTTEPTCILADPASPGFFRNWIVAGNKFLGLSTVPTRGIWLRPAEGAATDDWLICNNVFTSYDAPGRALELTDQVRRVAMFGNIFVNGHAVGVTDNSKEPRGFTSQHKVSIGQEAPVTLAKDLYVKSPLPVRPRIYLQGQAGVSSPGIEFGFNDAATERCAIVSNSPGAEQAQLLFLTKPAGGPTTGRVIIDPNGHVVPVADNAYNLGAAGSNRWKDIFAVTKTSVLDVDWGSGKVMVPVLEGPEYLFYDSGTAVIGSRGQVSVALDRRAVAVCNTQVPYRVVTSGATVTEKKADRFTLKGTPGETVDWMLLAVRAGFENVRWRDVNDPEPVGLRDPAKAIAKKSARNNLRPARPAASKAKRSAARQGKGAPARRPRKPSRRK
jgi:hypothetical protein